MKKETKNLLKLRRRIKKKKPSFKRQEYSYKKSKRFGKVWRRPKGKHSKLRMKENARGRSPGTGYSSPKFVRGLNPSGLKEVSVSRPKDVEKLDPKKQAAVISKGVGKKKRLEIMKLASSKGVKVSN
jgi:large subunit ribosomal protein L32e